jgi:hypothetical protein
MMRRFRPGKTNDELETHEVKMDNLSLQTHVQRKHLDTTRALREMLSSDQIAIDEIESTLTAIYRCPVEADESLWQYEHIRQFTIELSAFAVYLSSVCDNTSCPQMKATDEWMYLCAAHKQPQECSAIDYIIHTLDGTAALLNSNKWFPVGSPTVPESSLKYFHSITRRLYRILSHAFFHHKDAFDEFEFQNHLCRRFVAFSKVYDLIPPKLLIIPHGEYSSCESSRVQNVRQSLGSVIFRGDRVPGDPAQEKD